MKKIFIVLILILAILVAASCANQPAQVSVTAPVDTQVQESPSATVQTSVAQTTQPSPSSTMQPSPSSTTQQPDKEDVPAYLTAGLQKRSEMTPEWERFYYLSYYKHIEGYSSPDTFNENTSVDLDGDGKEEKITIIGGKPYDGVADVDPSFSDINVDIDGNVIKFTSETISYVSLPFTLEGRILDIDKNDGKKEILIEAAIMIGPTQDYIISYDDKKPRTIFKGEIDSILGAGYITIPVIYDTVSSDNLYYYDLLKMKSDRSGFEPAGNKYYPTLHQIFCWDENGNWDESKAAPTQWDQDLYTESGGDKKVSVKQGTPVFIGLYAKDSWLMILDAKGELLGWLDTAKVDYAAYTSSAFQPEGD